MVFNTLFMLLQAQSIGAEKQSWSTLRTAKTIRVAEFRIYFI
jgi:hypothetical protein